MTKVQLAFQRGYKAFTNQQSSANPYKDGSAAHQAYVKGWNESKADHYSNQGA